jgi:hypothetical protein
MVLSPLPINAIPGMGALTALNVSNSFLTRGVLKSYRGYTAAGSRKQDKWGQENGDYNTSTKGVVALGNAIRNNGALIKLDISSNDIGAEQEEDLQRICVASGIELNM